MRMFRKLFSDSVDYGGKNKMYVPDRHRYENMIYNRCGESGLKLPAISLGLWHNFGDTSPYSNMKELCFTAFDNGITPLTLPITTVRSPEVPKSISDVFFGKN